MRRLAAYGLGAATGWNVGNVGGVTADLASTYGVGLGAIGLLTTLLLISHSLVQVPGGRLIDRFGARRAGLASAAALGLGNLVAMAGASFSIAAAGRVVAGIGTGLAFLAGNALSRSGRRSNASQGLFGGLAVGAGGLAIATVPLAWTQVGWRAPFLTAVLFAALVAGLLALLPHAADQRPSTPSDDSQSVLADRRVHALAIVYSASFGFSVVAGTWAAEVLVRHGVLTKGPAATVASLTLLVGVVARPFGGWIAGRGARTAQRAVAASLAAGAIGTITIVVAHSATLAVAGTSLVGFAAGVPFVPAFAGAAALWPDTPATAAGVVNTAANATALIGTPLVGVAFGLSASGAIGLIAIATLWLAALAAVPAIGEALRALAPRRPPP
ncbi:hypothetical protein DSM104299_03621 [Baekduia alba]|uniref:MFS transporter n=1 Tax=Baekduia alba TaxID=2997333 RepID=UPI0023403A25|nr:MFS transporter [Baekduia alba]WCB94881.1 hypothetical protein DSM104299_03621 [Baekduia alba]